MKKFFLFSFLPTNPDLGLLVLRITCGALMLVLHGWPKLTKFSSMFDSFPDPLGIGHRLSYVLATGGEVIGSICVILGLFTRLGALWVGTVMGVAFFVAHDAALTGQRSGELALVYLAIFTLLVLSGGGRYSFDSEMGAK